MKTYLVLLLLLLGVVGWVYTPYFSDGVPYTHDGQIHIARLANYFVAYKQNQWPVRWAPNLNNGFGYPVFNYNYPLPYLLGIPFITANFSLESTYKVLMISALFAIVAGALLLLKDHFTKSAAFIAALTLGVSPYVANLMYVRGGLGEIWSIALFIWVVWALKRAFKANTLNDFPIFVLSLSGWLLAHNVMVLIGILILLGLSAWVLIHNKKSWMFLTGGWTTALLIASFFWIPAIWEKHLVNLDSSTLSTGFRDHALTMGQFFKGDWGWGFSFVGPVDGLDMSIGWFYSAMLVMVVGISLYRRSVDRLTLILMGLVGFSFIFSTSVGLPVAQLIPGFNYLQFPWRLVVIATLTLAFLTAKVLSALKPSWPIYLLLVLILIRHAGAVYRPVSTFSFSDHYYLETGQTTSTLDENMPKGFDKFKAYPLNNSVFLNSPVISLNADSEILIDSWHGSSRSYVVNALNPTTLVERGVRFAGWETQVSGDKVEYTDIGGEYTGLIAFDVPAGNHTVTTRFTQNTLPRLLGNTLSGVGLLLLGGVTAYTYLKQKKSP